MARRRKPCFCGICKGAQDMSVFVCVILVCQRELKRGRWKDLKTGILRHMTKSGHPRRCLTTVQLVIEEFEFESLICTTVESCVVDSSVHFQTNQLKISFEGVRTTALTAYTPPRGIRAVPAQLQ